MPARPLKTAPLSPLQFKTDPSRAPAGAGQPQRDWTDPDVITEPHRYASSEEELMRRRGGAAPKI
ncbi:MAG TPA: hypothetical protein VKT30_10155 [Caulobacteraceae bacterium]|nr:hypothetical protein [Caulobacteraceae bacterium]